MFAVSSVRQLHPGSFELLHFSFPPPGTAMTAVTTTSEAMTDVNRIVVVFSQGECGRRIARTGFETLENVLDVTVDSDTSSER